MSRTVAIWCPDWPVTAAGTAASTDPVAVLTAHRVVACSSTARAEGVRRGQRRREAQARCPDLVVLARDEDAEARAFEPIVTALEAIVPGVEIVRPGLALLGARSPTRYFGGESNVLAVLAQALAGLADDVMMGVADGMFAAEQAARRAMIVPPGGSAEFLAPLPITTLASSAQSPLTDLLSRLGLRTLGAFAALPERNVMVRFGPTGALAHRQASGRDGRPVVARQPPTDLTVTLELDEPVDRVDTLAFTASGSVEQFVGGLAARGLVCTCFEMLLGTDRGEQSSRRWRHSELLSVSDIVDRLRWQLEGWRTGPGRPTGGVVRLTITPIETLPVGVNQQGLWGGAGERDKRAHRAMARVQTLLGPGSVLVPVVQGGRTPAERSRLVPWGDDASPQRAVEPPWPGRLPSPAPTVLFDPPRPVQVLDVVGDPVRVTDRGAVPRPPAAMRSPGAQPIPITAWAGPWPVDERWWDETASTAVVLFQLVDVQGRAYLASCQVGTGPSWTLDAVYD